MPKEKLVDDDETNHKQDEMRIQREQQCGELGKQRCRSWLLARCWWFLESRHNRQCLKRKKGLAGGDVHVRYEYVHKKYYGRGSTFFFFRPEGG